MQIPRRKADLLRKHDDGPIYLTRDGLQNRKDRLLRLKNSLPEFIAEAQRTAAYGDRSDNAEYKEAKGILRRTHRQIFSLEDQIKRAIIISSKPNASNTVHLGSTVVLKENGIQKTFEIVGPQETNPSRGRISHQSPLGVALLDHKKDDVVMLKTENGPRNYHILEIR